MQYSAKDIAEFIRPLAAIVGGTGFVMLFTSLRVLRRHMQEGRTVILGTICLLVELSVIGLAIYMVILSPDLPAK